MLTGSRMRLNAAPNVLHRYSTHLVENVLPTPNRAKVWIGRRSQTMESTSGAAYPGSLRGDLREAALGTGQSLRERVIVRLVGPHVVLTFDVHLRAAGRAKAGRPEAASTNVRRSRRAGWCDGIEDSVLGFQGGEWSRGSSPRSRRSRDMRCSCAAGSGQSSTETLSGVAVRGFGARKSSDLWPDMRRLILTRTRHDEVARPRHARRVWITRKTAKDAVEGASTPPGACLLALRKQSARRRTHEPGIGWLEIVLEDRFESQKSTRNVRSALGFLEGRKLARRTIGPGCTRFACVVKRRSKPGYVLVT